MAQVPQNAASVNNPAESRRHPRILLSASVSSSILGRFLIKDTQSIIFRFTPQIYSFITLHEQRMNDSPLCGQFEE